MIRIAFTGDMLCYPCMSEYFTLNGVLNFSPAFEKARPDFEKCDFIVGNLETPIAGEALGYTNERYRFNSPYEYLEAVKGAGVGLVCAANNHCMDRGETGIVRTIENCEKAGLDIIGIYRDAESRDCVYVKEICGIRAAFINYTYGTNAFHHKLFLSEKGKDTVNLFQPEETLPGAMDLLAPMEKIGEYANSVYGFGDSLKDG